MIRDRDTPAKMNSPQLSQPNFADETGKLLFETSLAEYPDRNNRAARTKTAMRGIAQTG
jgi:hypothetical protein